jgi:hypothetical protein
MPEVWSTALEIGSESRATGKAAQPGGSDVGAAPLDATLT